MSFIGEAVLSFIAATAFGIVFNAPKKSLPYCGLVGMTGWLVSSYVLDQTGEQIIASFSGAFTIAFVAHLMAKRFKMPMIIFSVSGIIPLVPGGSAYNAMRNVVEKDYGSAVEFAAYALMVSGSIAMGLVFAEILTQVWRETLLRIKKT